MDTTNLLEHLPRILFGAVCLGFLYLLYRYKTTHDFNRWLQRLHDDAARAKDNLAYRREQLAEAEAALAALPPETPEPVTRRREVVLRAYPRFIFLLGGLATAMLFVAVAAPSRENNGDWPLYVAPLVLLATAVLYAAHRRERGRFARVQLLNRLYLYQKFENDPRRFETGDMILAYYPQLTPFWVELATQHEEGGDMKKALATVRRGQKTVENNLDLGIAEAAFLHRMGDADGVEKTLRKIESYPRQPSDPRPAIYAAAAALLRQNREKALENAAKALQLDSAFTIATVREPGNRLEALKTLLREENLAPVDG